VLVIGGGDGGCLREICRHAAVQHVTICEIDQLVMDVSKEYMKQMSSGFFEPKCAPSRFAMHA
jgi:spermidine synthase